MFTGIVEEVGRVESIDIHTDAHAGTGAIRIACERVSKGIAIGDSVNVNGCCLTVTDLTEGQDFTAQVMGETLRRTAVGALQPGDGVNLERALAVDGRLGGHLVQGHVDATAEIVEVRDEGGWSVMRVELPAHLAPYVVEKGSITIDGTSLTVMGVAGTTFDVGLIPHTMAVTALGSRRAGDLVNLEVDVIAKYVERLLSRGVTTPYGPGPEQEA